MPVTCQYCGTRKASTTPEGMPPRAAPACINCGAPLPDESDSPAADYRNCPHCTRRLIAIGSTICNYCGKALPQNYVTAREAALRRITAFEDRHDERHEPDDSSGHDSDFVRKALDSWLRIKRTKE